MMRRMLLWVLTLFVAGMFLFAGAMKLSAQPMMVATFGQIGLGQWFRVFTGTLEVVGALLVLVPAPPRLTAGSDPYPQVPQYRLPPKFTIGVQGNPE